MGIVLKSELGRDEMAATYSGDLLDLVLGQTIQAINRTNRSWI